LSACGDQTAQNSAKGQKKSPEPSDKTKKEEVSTAEQQTAETKSVSALTVDELGDCAESNLKQLVYLTTESKFYTCEVNGWVEIEVTNETNVVNQYTVTTIWEDVATGKFWFVKDYASSYTGCPDSGSSQVADSWKQATPAETIEAIDNGLFGNANVKVYTVANKFVYSSDTSVVYTASDYTGSVSAFTVCISY
jgi:hypothetical protein